MPRHWNKLKRRRVVSDALKKGRVDVGSRGVGDEVTGKDERLAVHNLGDGSAEVCLRGCSKAQKDPRQMSHPVWRCEPGFEGGLHRAVEPLDQAIRLRMVARHQLDFAAE